MTYLQSLLANLQLTRRTAFLITVWLLVMIFVPIANWIWGEAAMLRLVNIGVLAQTTAVLSILISAWGWRRTLQTAVVIAVITYSVEWIGSHTGLPFGRYHYTDVLQPQISGVPLLIPLAWFMMLPSAWAIAERLGTMHFYPKKHSQAQTKSVLHLSLFALLSGLALTAWDLMLDPQMVGWGLWVWEQPGGYFGIPWLNFGGWILTAVLLTALIRPSNLPIQPLLLIYTLTWFLETFGLAFFWGMPGPALVGGVVMGLFVWLGWRFGIRDWQLTQPSANLQSPINQSL
ncbi:MAG: carotenoid biosynthesis protein [Chloroflexota bacterium]